MSSNRSKDTSLSYWLKWRMGGAWPKRRKVSLHNSPPQLPSLCVMQIKKRKRRERSHSCYASLKQRAASRVRKITLGTDLYEAIRWNLFCSLFSAEMHIWQLFALLLPPMYCIWKRAWYNLLMFSTLPWNSRGSLGQLLGLSLLHLRELLF